MRRMLFVPWALILLSMLSGSAVTQTTQKADLWLPLRFLIGTWEGTIEGRSGKGTCERQYEFALNDKFIQVRNKSSYPAQAKNPTGEVHEDWGFFSFDQGRTKFVLRQFHVEGFVNQYLLERRSEDGRSLVFVTESIENIPVGWRAKETYRIVSDNEFNEVFELAAPGREYELYSETRFKRKTRP